MTSNREKEIKKTVEDWAENILDHDAVYSDFHRHIGEEMWKVLNSHDDIPLCQAKRLHLAVPMMRAMSEQLSKLVALAELSDVGALDAANQVRKEILDRHTSVQEEGGIFKAARKFNRERKAAEG